jgi:endonuclease YncB( thermonuclease family)
MSNLSLLETVCDKEIKCEILKSITLQVKIVRVIDGDTVVLAYINKTGQISKVTARLFGIDTPELRKEPWLAKRARNYLINLSTNVEEIDIDDSRTSKELQRNIDQNTKLLWAKFNGNDKYGRSLVELYFYHNCDCNFSSSLNQMILNAKLARPYDGTR